MLQHPVLDLRPSNRWFPAQALLCSSLLHLAVTMVWVLLLPALVLLLPQPRFVPEVEEVKEHKYVLTLPALGTQATGSAPSAAAGRKAKGAASAARPSSDNPGLAFPGPQPIISSPQHPDNKIQTVRQPDLPNPPKLKVPIAAPNILQIAAPAPPVLAPQPPVVQVNAKANAGVHIPLQPRPSENLPPAKLNLPRSGDPASTVVGALITPVTTAPKLAEQVPPAPPVVGMGSDKRNLLVLNAMSSGGPIPAIPPGEAAGAFSVSPEGNRGTSAGSSPAGAAGSGVKGTGPTGAGSGSGTQPNGGPGIGSGNSGHEGSGGAGAGAGSGAGPGTTAGNGPGGGTGSGSGAGPAGRGSGNVGVAGGTGGPGSGAFPDVSIGAAGPPAVDPHGAPRAAIPHGTYGMTIVATGASGGVGDFGVFKNEVVYTVYIDMTEPDHSRPKWTLQYSAAGGADATPVAPFPTAKEYPHLPAEQSARNIGRKLVVTGFITRDGKFDRLRVIQSPNPLLIQPLLDCLVKWAFQPAELNGEQIAVKFLLGITITAE